MQESKGQFKMTEAEEANELRNKTGEVEDELAALRSEVEKGSNRQRAHERSE